jgi:4-nitrophenyl phosphatase
MTTPVPSRYRFVLCDLDGVVWLQRFAIPGAADAVDRLRQDGRRVLFVTNNSMSTIAEQERALAAIDIPAHGDVVTSAQAAASLVDTGERVLVCAGDGVREAVAARGAEPIREGECAAVIVGLHQDFDYWRLQAAHAALRGGARFVATNEDATYPTPDGPIPGAGSLVAAVATVAGARPTIAGKPHAPMASLVRERCGPEFSSGSAIMVGDRFSTDGRFAAELGSAFAMVRSGVTPAGRELPSEPTIDAADLAAVADTLLVGHPLGIVDDMTTSPVHQLVRPPIQRVIGVGADVRGRPTQRAAGGR